MTNAAEAIKAVAVAGPRKHAEHAVDAGAAMAARSKQPSSHTCDHRHPPPSLTGELKASLEPARATPSGERGAAVR